MQISSTELSGVFLLTPRRFVDGRGWFSESYNASILSGAGLPTGWVQDNHSYSAMKGTVRGLHFQAPPHAQDKLVRCTRGAIYDVAVDIRRGSATYGKWLGIELTRDNGFQLFIPKGFLHGFVTIERDSEVQYKCSDLFAPDCDRSVRWDSVGIDWPSFRRPVLSDKDANATPFALFQSPFVYGENA